MPNPLGRRRSSAAGEVEQLKKQLEELTQNYARDMQNISADMATLSQKVEPPAPAE